MSQIANARIETTTATLSILLLLLFVSPLLAQSQQALFFTCDFMEKVEGRSWEVVDSRSYVAPTRDPFYFSMGNFTCNLNTTVVTDSIISLRSTLNAYDRIPQNYFDERVVIKEASVFFDSVLVRGKSTYRVRITFDSLGTSKSDCSYTFGGDGYESDPSGDFDFYFVKRTLGDYRWNPIRDAVEYDYDQLVSVFHINERDKSFYYICPCVPSDIGWDKRWKNGYDFARKNIFAEFSHGVNELHPQVVYMVKFMRIWGYAPSLLLEGVASTLEYADYFAKQAYADGTLPDLASLGRSADFRALDRRLSTGAAGSFAYYLIRKSGDARFRNWYLAATDLTLAESFADAYGKPMTEALNEWHHYLDTLTINPNSLEYFATRANQFLSLSETLYFTEAKLRETGDSTDVADELANLYFTFGEYNKAEKFVRKMVESARGKAKNERLFLANMLLAQGEIPQAEDLYYEVARDDSLAYMTYFKLGQIELDRGNHSNALELFQRARALTTAETFFIDADIWIGDVFAAQGVSDSSQFYYQEALDRAKILAVNQGENPLNHLAVGRAALRLGSTDLAKSHLQSALFLEERMFYLGQTFLALGMAYDAAGEHDQAINEYRQVLEFPTAYLDRKLAERYIQSPYRN